MKCLIIFDRSAINQPNYEIVAPSKKDARKIIEKEIMSTAGEWTGASTNWVLPEMARVTFG